LHVSKFPGVLLPASTFFLLDFDKRSYILLPLAVLVFDHPLSSLTKYRFSFSFSFFPTRGSGYCRRHHRTAPHRAATAPHPTLGVAVRQRIPYVDLHVVGFETLGVSL